MKTQVSRIAFVALFLLTLGSAGCDNTNAPSNGSSTQAAAVNMHPQKVGDWTFKSSKVKAQDWGTEYSGTYANGADELKLVVNEATVDDPPAWAELFVKPEDFGGNQAMLDTRADKETFMVRVGKRWRVDFKSKSPGTVDLRAIAREYDFSALK